jgi:hypothetical protein
MTHLNESELIDAAEGHDGAAADHAAQCDRCRDTVARLRETIAGVRTADVPEPSPLFWDHFATRVRHAIDAEDAADAADTVPVSGWRAWAHGPGAWSAAAAALVLALVAGVWQWSAPERPARSGAPAAGPAAVVADAAGDDHDDSELGDIESDEAWAIVRTVADAVEWDDDGAAAGLFARPGWAERAAQTLTADEREALFQLLQTATEAAPEREPVKHEGKG